jgi:hypothetical protein
MRMPIQSTPVNRGVSTAAVKRAVMPSDACSICMAGCDLLVLLCQNFSTSILSRDWRDAARAARQHCHESSAQSPPNGRNRIRNVAFRPQWRSPSADKFREL